MMRLVPSNGSLGRKKVATKRNREERIKEDGKVPIQIMTELVSGLRKFTSECIDTVCFYYLLLKNKFGHIILYDLIDLLEVNYYMQSNKHHHITLGFIFHVLVKKYIFIMQAH
ncbi:hypothetical protein ACJX0J_020867 [Zea mays]